MSEINTNALVDSIVRLSGDPQVHPTLKAMASVLGVPAQRLYSVAKQPIEGKEYNAKEYNFDAINRFVARRLEGKFDSMDAFIAEAQLVDEQLKTSDGRRRGRTAGAAKADDIQLADGSVIPGRRAELEVGQVVYMRGNGKNAVPKMYEVAMMTETHVVLQEPNSPVLASYSNWTLNQKLMSAEAFAAQTAAEATEA